MVLGVPILKHFRADAQVRGVFIFLHEFFQFSFKPTVVALAEAVLMRGYNLMGNSPSKTCLEILLLPRPLQ